MPEFTLPPSTLPNTSYNKDQFQLMREFATRYIWWKTVDEALKYPDRILAQVMNIGIYEDLGRLLATFTVNELQHVLEQAEPGWFNGRSWNFWHLYLGVIPLNGTPPSLTQRAYFE